MDPTAGGTARQPGRIDRNSGWRQEIHDPVKLQDVSDIMDLPKASLVNVNPDPSDYPGAIRITRYRENETSNESQVLRAGRHTRSSQKANISTTGRNAHDLMLSSSEVKDRAAWAWWRSAQLYERSAINLEQAGTDNDALIINVSKEKALLLANVINTLRKRARLAKSHAHKLLAEGTATDFGHWISSARGLLQDDINFYVKQVGVYEAVQRVKVAILYQEAARKFFLEALYTFIDDLLDSQGTEPNITSNQYVRDLWLKGDPLNSLQKAINLWSSASSWSVLLGEEGSVNRTGGLRQWRFRQMMRRAIHHRAHAEWLTGELCEQGEQGTTPVTTPHADNSDKKTKRQSTGMRKLVARVLGGTKSQEPKSSQTISSDPIRSRRLEPWRLANPSDVELYLNDCVITTHLSMANPKNDPTVLWTAPEDDYMEWYVCTLVQHSDYRWDVSTGYGAPGAPEKIYEELATRMFPETPVDLHTIEPIFRDFLSGRLSPSSTQLETYIAVIGDKIFGEWLADSFSQMVLKQTGVSIQDYLARIKADIEAAIDLDTIFTTGARPSAQLIYDIIERYANILQAEVAKQTDFNYKLHWIFLLESNVRMWIQPWFGLQLSIPYYQLESGGRVKVQILDLKTQTSLVGQRCSMSKVEILCLAQAKLSQQFFDRERQRIIDGSSDLMKPQKQYAKIKGTLLRYRTLIETGDWSTVPLVKGWSLSPFKVQSPVSVYLSLISVAKAKLLMNEETKRDIDALTVDLKDAEHGHDQSIRMCASRIKPVFDSLCEQGFGKFFDPDPRDEEFSKVRNSSKSAPLKDLSRPSDLEDSQGQMFYKIFPADYPRDQIGPDVFAATYSNDPALLEATKFGDKIRVRQLLEDGENADIIDDLGLTPLDVALSRGDVDVVDILLKHGAKLEDQIMREALNKWNEDILQCIFDHRTDLLSFKLDNGNTILHKAAQIGSERIIKCVLGKTADIDARDASRSTALHMAALEGHEQVVRLLLEGGAHVEARDDMMRTPLMLAAFAKSLGVMKVLLEFHADIEANVQGLTPLLTVAVDHDEQLTRFLLSMGANPNAHDTLSGSTPLHIFASKDNIPMIELLVEMGAAVDSKAITPAGQTPLHVAAGYGMIAAARKLLQLGANVNGTFEGGFTPLHMAAGAGNYDIVKLLLSRGADSTMDTTQMQTPFARAARGGHDATAKLLLEQGLPFMTITQLARGVSNAAAGGHMELFTTLLGPELVGDLQHEIVAEIHRLASRQ